MLINISKISCYLIFSFEQYSTHFNICIYNEHTTLIKQNFHKLYIVRFTNNLLYVVLCTVVHFIFNSEYLILCHVSSHSYNCSLYFCTVKYKTDKYKVFLFSIHHNICLLKIFNLLKISIN